MKKLFFILIITIVTNTIQAQDKTPQDAVDFLNHYAQSYPVYSESRIKNVKGINKFEVKFKLKDSLLYIFFAGVFKSDKIYYGQARIEVNLSKTWLEKSNKCYPTYSQFFVSDQIFLCSDDGYTRPKSVYLLNDKKKLKIDIDGRTTADNKTSTVLTCNTVNIDGENYYEYIKLFSYYAKSVDKVYDNFDKKLQKEGYYIESMPFNIFTLFEQSDDAPRAVEALEFLIKHFGGNKERKLYQEPKKEFKF